MGILFYEDFETPEEAQERSLTEVAQSNRNYTGRRLPERAPRRESDSDEDDQKVTQNSDTNSLLFVNFSVNRYC